MPIQTALQALENDLGASPFGFRNIIMNGDMAINQRSNTSITVGSGQANGQAEYLTDRWRCWSAANGNTLAATFERVTDAPEGFKYSVRATPTVTGTPNSQFYSFIWQGVEYNNIRRLKWGTGQALPLTLSFWVKSSSTGTFSAIVTNNGNNGMSFKIWRATYTVNQSNTWEYKTISIVGDTDSTWLNATSDNGVGLFVGLTLGGTTGITTPVNTWDNTTAYNRVGDFNFFSSTSNTWQVTGIQLEIGREATPFDFRPYGTELQLCQRYFEAYTYDTDSLHDRVAMGTGFQSAISKTFYVQKRNVPTVSSLNTEIRDGSNQPIAISSIAATKNDILVYGASGSTGVGTLRFTGNSTNSYLRISSEF